MNKFPQRMVERYQDQFEEASVFGIPLTKLNKDELMATCCHLADGQKRAGEEHERSLDFMRSLLNPHNLTPPIGGSR